MRLWLGFCYRLSSFTHLAHAAGISLLRLNGVDAEPRVAVLQATRQRISRSAPAAIKVRPATTAAILKSAIAQLFADTRAAYLRATQVSALANAGPRLRLLRRERPFHFSPVLRLNSIAVVRANKTAVFPAPRIDARSIWNRLMLF